MTEFEQKLAEFVRVADEVVADYWKRMQFTYAPAPTHVVESGGQQWVKVFRTQGQYGKTITAFIALKDAHTKTLGTIKKGDIMKPANYKAPAKHARGNLFTTTDYKEVFGMGGSISYLT